MKLYNKKTKGLFIFLFIFFCFFSYIEVRAESWSNTVPPWLQEISSISEISDDGIGMPDWWFLALSFVPNIFFVPESDTPFDCEASCAVMSKSCLSYQTIKYADPLEGSITPLIKQGLMYVCSPDSFENLVGIAWTKGEFGNMVSLGINKVSDNACRSIGKQAHTHFWGPYRGYSDDQLKVGNYEGVVLCESPCDACGASGGGKGECESEGGGNGGNISVRPNPPPTNVPPPLCVPKTLSLELLPEDACYPLASEEINLKWITNAVEAGPFTSCEAVPSLIDGDDGGWKESNIAKESWSGNKNVEGGEITTSVDSSNQNPYTLATFAMKCWDPSIKDYVTDTQTINSRNIEPKAEIDFDKTYNGEGLPFKATLSWKCEGGDATINRVDDKDFSKIENIISKSSGNGSKEITFSKAGNYVYFLECDAQGYSGCSGDLSTEISTMEITAPPTVDLKVSPSPSYGDCATKSCPSIGPCPIENQCLAESDISTVNVVWSSENTTACNGYYTTYSEIEDYMEMEVPSGGWKLAPSEIKEELATGGKISLEVDINNNIGTKGTTTFSTNTNGKYAFAVVCSGIGGTDSDIDPVIEMYVKPTITFSTENLNDDFLTITNSDFCDIEGITIEGTNYFEFLPIFSFFEKIPLPFLDAGEYYVTCGGLGGMSATAFTIEDKCFPVIPPQTVPVCKPKVGTVIKVF